MSERMNGDQVRDLLAVIHGYDRRSVNASTISAWTEAAQRAGWVYTDAVEAVRAHFDASRDFLMPSMVTERIRAARRLPPLPGGGKEARSPRSDPNCELCDEYGWVIDPEDELGWAVPCRHDKYQLLPRKPADVHAAAQMLREGRRREENGGGYARVTDYPDHTEPRR